MVGLTQRRLCAHRLPTSTARFSPAAQARLWRLFIDTARLTPTDGDTEEAGVTLRAVVLLCNLNKVTSNEQLQVGKVGLAAAQSGNLVIASELLPSMDHA